MADVLETRPPSIPSPPLFGGKRDSYGLYAAGLLLAVAIHAGAGISAYNAPVSKPPVRITAVIKKAEPPPPPPPPAPEPPKPEPPKPPPPKKVLAKAPVEPPKEPPAPPPPNSEPPKEPPKKPVPILSGVTLESTVEGPSSFAVAVGNTMYDDPNKNKSKPGEVQKYSAPVYREAPAKETGGTSTEKGVWKPVPKFSVSTEPEVLQEVKAPYPVQARQAAIEGVVECRVEIWQDGTVRSVKVVRGLGYGLDEAAVEALKKFRFKPATVDGQPVQYTIPKFVYRFELDS